MVIKLKIKNILMMLMCLVMLLPFLDNSGNNNAYAASDSNVTQENQQIESLPVSESNVTQENQQIELIPTYYCEGNLVDFSDSKSSIRLECGHSGYAWEHIWLKHLMGLHKEQGTRFKSASWNQRDMLTISMEVINNATTLERHPTIEGRASKTAWSSYNTSNVKVVIQDTGRKNGYGGIVWNIVTVYPVK